MRKLSPFQNFTHSEPVDGRTMPKRRPADDHRIYCHLTATDRCPGRHRWGACRSSSGHRLKILSSAEWIGLWPNSLPAAAGRRPLHDFYDMVQGRENPAMICRCQKVGIGEKSCGHRRIYKACDVPFSSWNVKLRRCPLRYLTLKVLNFWKFTSYRSLKAYGRAWGK